MGKVTWAKERLDYLREHYPSCADTRELAREMGCSYAAIQNKARILGLKRLKRTTRNTATQKEMDYIRRHYLTVPIKRMAAQLGRSHSFVAKRLKALGLQVPADLAEQRRKENLFKKGHVPHNKGKPLTEEVRRKVSRTWFKKGNVPPKTKTDLYVSARYHRRDKRWYLYIREGLGKWELLHRHMYKKFVGEIPQNYVVAFKDGDSLNCITSNLELITRQENMQRNSITNYPEEIKDIIRIKGVLTRKINQKLKSI